MAIAAYDFYIVKGDVDPILQVQLQKQPSGSPVNLTGAVSVTFVMTDQSGTTIVSQPAAVDNAAQGQVHYAWAAADTAKAGSYTGRFVVSWGTGQPQTFPSPNGLSILIKDEAPADPLSATVYPQPQYPYPTGYARVADVRARINSGAWDPSDPTSSPSFGQVEQWLLESTAYVDVALGTRGYFVPLQPLQGWTVPTGMQLYNGIGVGAWVLLRNITASYVAAQVQLVRHGGVGAENDKSATTWLEIYDDFLTRIESAADNLRVFGATGTFAPEIDPSEGFDSGSLGAVIAQPAMTEAAVFSKYMNLGSGTPLDTPSGFPPSGAPNIGGN